MYSKHENGKPITCSSSRDLEMRVLIAKSRLKYLLSLPKPLHTIRDVLQTQGTATVKARPEPPFPTSTSLYARQT